MFSVTSVLPLNDFPGFPSNLQGVLNTRHSVQEGGSGLKFPLRHPFLLKQHSYPGKEREEAEKKPVWLNKSPVQAACQGEQRVSELVPGTQGGCQKSGARRQCCS